MKTSQADSVLPTTGVSPRRIIAPRHSCRSPPCTFSELREPTPVSCSCALPALFSSSPTPGYAEGTNMTYHVRLSFAMVSLLEVGAIGGGCVFQVRGHRTLGLCRSHAVQARGCEGRFVLRCCSAADSETLEIFGESSPERKWGYVGRCLLVLASRRRVWCADGLLGTTDAEWERRRKAVLSMLGG